MHKTIHLAPSILAADFTRLGEQIEAAEQAGVTWIHVDVMDGRFVPNITMGPLVVAAARRVTSLPLDVHLMIVEPERYIEAFAQAGANHITVHIEASPNLHRTLQTIKSVGCKAGVALNPHTPAFMLEDVMHMLDIVNVMTVNPGFGGQSFLPETMSKIARIRAMIGDRGQTTDLVVDGGINVETAMAATQSGANVLVVGSAVFNDEQSVSENVDRLRGALAQWRGQDEV